MKLSRLSLMLLLAAVLSLTVGCATTLRPRTSAELPYKEYKKLGAVTDASRAFPIAFYADPTQDPVELDVPYVLPAGHVLAAQWMTHLAARMNQALHEVGLYDRRFAAFAHQVFHNDLASGDYIYNFKGDGAVKRDIEVSGARLVKLRLKSMKPVTSGSMQIVRLVVELKMGNLQRMYQAESNAADWDRACFDGIARKILGDPKFWKGVSQTP